MSLNEIKQSIKQKLASEFEAIELNSMLSMLIEHITGWNQVQQVVNKDTPITEAQIKAFDTSANELLKGRPIQYIIGKSWFLGNEFIVNENVLIPRPETEELVEWIVEYASIVDRPLSIIDIGTGSDPYRNFIYTSFQELATNVSHRRTATLAKEYGNKLLSKMCGGGVAPIMGQ